MAVTKTLIKSRATDDPSTASVLTHANDELSRDNPNGMFVTLFIGILDIRSGEFDYTNAGHNPPYLIRTDGPPEAMSDRHGPIVGAMKGMVYRKGTDVMLPGDILYMYTDGVTEEMDTDGQLFSDERLAALISTQTIDSVEAAIDEHHDEAWAAARYRAEIERLLPRRDGSDPRAQFLLLLHESSAALALTPAERLANAREYGAWARSLGSDFVDGAELNDDAVLVRAQASAVEPDPPSAENEHVAGYFLVRAAGTAEAATLAQTCPHLDYGWIEVRALVR